MNFPIMTTEEYLMPKSLYIIEDGEDDYHYFDSKPNNDPTVLECQDKMINEV